MIRKTKRCTLKNPAFIAAWPGMGEVAIRTGLFLKDILPFEPFAQITNSGFFMPQGIISKDGIVDFPALDEGTFYLYKDPARHRDIVLFLAEAQPAMDRAYAFAQMIMEFLVSIKIKTVFTFASLPQPIDYTKDSRVWFVATDDSIKEEFQQYSINPLPDGQISGLNGLLTGVSGEYGIPSICFLAEIPFYTVQIENPKATKALVTVLGRFLNMEFDLNILDQKARGLEEEIERLINYVRGEVEADEYEDEPLDEEDVQMIKTELERYGRIPGSVQRRIDTLFEKAYQEISYAQELKMLLDKWGVYKEYEDRFLDLFKKRGLDH